MNTSSNLFALSAITMACAMAMSGMAQAAEAEQAKDQKVHQLQKVEVDEVAEKTGETVITTNELRMQASSTGTVTDSLRGQSFVQFDVNSRSATAGAEITPPLISIRGSRPNEVNYMINGLPNNNSFGGSGWINGKEGDEPQGDPQGMILTTDLLDSINVLSENVSAEYGDFTGGVVDAKYRDAHMDRWHVKAWVRHTRDSWTKQHWTQGQDKYLDQPRATKNDPQKEFKRSTVGASFEGPLFDGKLGALFSVQKTHSSTPVYYVRYNKGPQYKYKTTRDNDNFLLRLNTDATNDFYVSSTLIYSPYESDLHAGMTDDAHFAIQGGGFNFSLNTRANLSFGVLKTDFGWNRSEVNRDHDHNVSYYWYEDATDANSKKVMSGGQGDWDKTQNIYTAKTILDINPIYSHNFEHHFRLGAEVQHKAVENELEGFISYNTPKLDIEEPPVNIEMGDGRIEGQWASKRQFAPHKHSKADFTSAAFFFEDIVKVERFSFRPGIRLSYDDVTEDVNIAPRFKFDADVFNDGRLKANLGYNRYYGSEVLNYATRFDKGAVTQTRVTNPDGTSGWQEYQDNSVIDYNIGDIETPYSDEFVAGISTKVYDTDLSLQAVIRRYRDQLKTRNNIEDREAPLKDFSHLVLTNDGQTDYKGVTFTVSKNFDLEKFGRHSTQLGVTWSELKSNSSKFNDSWEDQDAFEDVLLDGKRIKFNDLPASNFNSDWVITYSHNASFMNDRLRANMLMRWESAADRIEKLSTVDPTTQLKRYITHENEDLFNADLSLDYDLIKTSVSTLTLNMDVMNLFDNKNIVNTSGSDSYTMGRQFYLGMSYEY